LARRPHLLGDAPVRQWSLADVQDWKGPPSIWAQWD